MRHTTRRTVLGGLASVSLLPKTAHAQQPDIDKAKAQGRRIIVPPGGA